MLNSTCCLHIYEKYMYVYIYLKKINTQNYSASVITVALSKTEPELTKAAFCQHGCDHTRGCP